jgi:hypothetical protein
MPAVTRQGIEPSSGRALPEGRKDDPINEDG